MKKYLVAVIMTLVVLSLPAVCLADDGFDIAIDVAHMTVNGSGTDTHIITDSERKSFGITDKPLKNAVGKYYGGSAPDVAYVHNEKNTKWSTPVQTTVKLVSAQMTHTEAVPMVLTTGELENDTDQPATMTATLKQTVTKSHSQTWSHSDAVTVSQKFNYKVGETGASWTSQWGESKTDSEAVTIETSLSSGVTVPAHGDFRAELWATKSTLEVTVTYDASLKGDVLAAYLGMLNPCPPRAKAINFIPITSVMAAADLPTNKQITQTISICDYSNAKIKIIDTKTGAVKCNVPVKLKFIK